MEAYEFRSGIRGNGFNVEVSIVVSGETLGPDVHEVSEHAQMVASRVASLGRPAPGLPPFGGVVDAEIAF